MILIYMLFNKVSHKPYVGQTKFSLHRRWLQHQSSARQGYDFPICRAIRKYGSEAFELYELALVPNRALANKLERCAIQSMRRNTVDDYNATSGGDAAFSFSPEANRNRSDALKGIKWSAAHRQHLSESLCDKRFSSEVICTLYADGLSVPEVARRIGATPTIVRKKLKRAKVVIRPASCYLRLRVITSEFRNKCREARNTWWSSDSGTERRREMCLHPKSV